MKPTKSTPIGVLKGHLNVRALAKLFGGAHLGMIDIGGDFTEIVFSRKGQRFSVPVGTVRLTDR